MENKNSLNLNKKDIRYLINKKEIEKKAKLFNVLSNVTKLVIGAGAGVIGVLAYLELLTPTIIALGSTSLVTLGVGTLLGNVAAKQNKNKCDEVLERVKLIAQHQCSERLIDGPTLKLVRSDNVQRDLKNYSYEGRTIMPDGEIVTKIVERDDLQIGTVSKQYVISDIIDGEEEVIGAIEETKISGIERRPTDTGSEECVVSTYGYKWVPTSEIRPYDVEKCNTKSKKR